MRALRRRKATRGRGCQAEAPLANALNAAASAAKRGHAVSGDMLRL